jgi:hypothetical protein
MALEPDWKEWPWVVRHGAHDALYLRGFVPGDFDDGAPLLPNYALALDGSIMDPATPVACGTCATELRGQDVSVHERINPARDYRVESQGQRKRNPNRGKTLPGNCYWCNLPLGRLNARGGHTLKIRRDSGIISVYSQKVCDSCGKLKSPVPERFALLENGAR